MADQRFVRFIITNGTTICIAKTAIGTWVASDSLSTLILTEKEKELKKPSETYDVKGVKIGDHLYASVAGNSGWYAPIINALIEKVQTEKSSLNPDKCVEYALTIFNKEDYDVPSHWEKIEGFDIKKYGCSICFSSYNEGRDVPLKVVNVERNAAGSVTVTHLLTPSEIDALGNSPKPPHFKTICVQGTGGRYAKPVLNYHRDIFEEEINKREHVQALVRSMAMAFRRDPNHTGGHIRIDLLTHSGIKTVLQETAENILKEQKDWLHQWERVIEH